MLLFYFILVTSSLLCVSQTKDPCYDLDCSNHTSRCQIPGYLGENCTEDRNECINGHTLCRHRGQCVNTIGSYRCTCLQGWNGSHCEKPDGSEFHECILGWTGETCMDDIDECIGHNNPCGNDRICKNTRGNYECLDKETEVGMIVGAVVGGVAVIVAVVAITVVYRVVIRKRHKTVIHPQDIPEAAKEGHS